MYDIHEQRCWKGLGDMHGGAGGDANPQAPGDPREQRGFLPLTGDPRDRAALGGSPLRSIAGRGRRMRPPAPGTGERAPAPPLSVVLNRRRAPGPCGVVPPPSFSFQAATN